MPTSKTRKHGFRPNMTDYEIYVLALVDKLNENALYPMNKTDAVKLAIEKAVKELLPDIVIKPKRKLYRILDF